MIDISVRELKKSFEIGHPVLQGLTFDVNAGEHIGILGPNGCGKTTLFRILSGEISPDEGEVSVRRGARVGLISQIPVYPAHYTAEDVLREAHRRLREISARLEEIEALLERSDSPELLREYDALSDDFRRLGGYDSEYELSRVANGLDIPMEMRERPFSLLSGGEKTRVNLARLILEDTDILLLDEPTNHLDLKAVEWLEDYVTHFKGTVLSISHDRYFLDECAGRCIELVDGKAEFYSGNYSFYLVERQRRFEEKLKRYEKDQAKLRQLEEASQRLRLWAFLGDDKTYKRAKSMEKRMEKLEATEKPRETKKLRASFKEREFSADEVIVADGLTKGFGGRALFSDLSLDMGAGERIALIGDNGSGKSTLVKLIMREEEPDAGWVRLGPSVRAAYLPQLVRFESPERSAVDTLLYECRCSPQQARDALGSFGFSGEDALKSVGTLSGGEQSRLRLCMLMQRDINLLILDEPTNHLDIASREWMEDALSSYGEAMLFVSHDRYFIEKFATRIWQLEGGVLTDFRGGFAEYNAYRARQRQLSAAKKANEKKPEKPKNQKQRTSDREKRVRAVEREIAKTEEAIRELDRQAEEHSSDYQELLRLGEERRKLSDSLDGLYSQWEELSEE